MPLAPFIPFANCADVVLEMTFGTQNCYLTMGVRKAAPFEGTDLADIGQAYIDWFSSYMADNLSTSLVLGAVKVTDLTTQFSPTATVIPTTTVAGTVSGTPAPNNTALVVSFKTSQRGRSFRGRNYVVGLVEGALTTTTAWGAAIVSSMGVNYNALPAALAAVGVEHVVLSRYVNGSRRTTGVATKVTSYVPREIIGTQRRRVAGHGI